MHDLISRQAAIDIERNATVDTNPSHFEAHQKFTQFMDDAEVSSFGRWQWSNGFNTALTAVGIDLKKLPSAQSDIILCKDCKHRPTATEAEKGIYWGFSVEFPDELCPLQCEDGWYNGYPGDEFYCGNAERREE